MIQNAWMRWPAVLVASVAMQSVGYLHLLTDATNGVIARLDPRLSLVLLSTQPRGR